MGRGGNVHRCPNVEVIHQGPCHTLQQKEELVQEVTRVEILNAIKDMPHEKAPGVDDDLLMFCKADIQSIRLVKQTFLKFYEASGLQANAEKSSVYLAGISNAQRQDILQELGYPEGTLPFKYLGVPLASKKLSIIQCWPLVEKITQKINCWTASLLSYAWRVQLIKSVLFGIQSYWAQIFLLPKKVMKMVEAICRSFLWTGTSSVSKKALVSWEKVCLPQVVGGLNVMNMVYWNKAVVAKHLWAAAKKKECLWIRWIHSFYIKQNMLEHMPIPKNAAWVVRKILETRKFIGEVQGLQGDLMSRLGQLQKGNSFSIKKLYRLQFPQLPKVPWKGIVLQPNLHPKFRSMVETTEKWLGHNRTIRDWQSEVAWISQYAIKKNGHWAIVTCVFGMMIYTIWRARNKLGFQGGITTVSSICKEIAIHIHTRGRLIQHWQEALEKLNCYP
ncbi:PREDICTED: uncharacterized protein LOC109207700 [Nicotiana attenuata]|uniref:uncharacterized protein LOC109207700 n=1 Tax=Nicotiana attenuata TaxID=49451 RepID=UPI000905D776|nr:PREDICTED: uncharacterized protein LOC109207700 [Nicotiana attenuata]